MNLEEMNQAVPDLIVIIVETNIFRYSFEVGINIEILEGDAKVDLPSPSSEYRRAVRIFDRRDSTSVMPNRVTPNNAVSTGSIRSPSRESQASPEIKLKFTKSNETPKKFMVRPMEIGSSPNLDSLLDVKLANVTLDNTTMATMTEPSQPSR